MTGIDFIQKYPAFGSALPIDHGHPAIELKAGIGVVVEFYVVAIGILAPELPALVGTQFGLAAILSRGQQARPEAFHVRRFKAEMRDAHRAFSGYLVGMEHLDEIALGHLEVIAERAPLTLELKGDRQTEEVNIEHAGCRKVADLQADMGQSCDHITEPILKATPAQH